MTAHQPARGTGDGFGYQPALDGLRAVAVVLVLLFHQGFSWMTGGYVGVSVFFTLSGYLITSLLLVEQRTSGAVSLRGFYRRRIKRLMPASLLCLGAIAWFGAGGAFARATGLRSDVTSAAMQVANWRALTRGTSYAQLIQGGASPVDHFWSLSVEEQFYWVWPLAFAGLALVARSRRTKVLAICSLAMAAVVAAPLIAWRWGPDVAYWATPARLGEILVGAALAAVLDSWRHRPAWLGMLVWPALTLVLLAAVALPSGHGFAYRGGLGVGALVSASLMAGLQVAGPVRSLLAARPFVALGRVSYGVYLYHWPIYVLLDTRRTGVEGIGLFAIRIVVTLATAVVSYFVVERPVRLSAWKLPVVSVAAVSATAITVVLALLVIPLDKNHFGADPGVAVQVTFAPATGPLPTLRPVTSSSVPAASTSTAPGSTLLPTPPRPVRIMVLGDSTAEALSAGLVEWATDHPALAQVDVLAVPGCGLIRGAAMDGDENGVFQKGCDEVLDVRLPAELRDRTPDVVVALITLPDAVGRRWPDADQPLPATDPRYEERLMQAYRTTTAQLLAVPGLQIVWLTPAPPADWALGHENGSMQADAWDGQLAAIEALVAEHPDRVHVLDFASWITQPESRGDRSLREDGLHLSPAGARTIVDDRLAYELLSIATGT